MAAFHRANGVLLQGLLHLKTHPIAVKMLTRIEDIPKGTEVPTRDLGRRFSVCQAFAMTRREGRSFALAKEDMWCFEPIIGYGFAEPTEFFLSGHNRYPGTAKTLEAGARWARSLPRFEVGKYVAMVCCPLESALVAPDVVIIYCDPGQLTQIIIAVNWIDGGDVVSRISGHSDCVYAVVPALQEKRFQVVSLCIGDRRRAMAQDDEMAFCAPGEKVNDLMAGLKALESEGSGHPVKPTMPLEYQLEQSYERMLSELGLLKKGG